MITLELTHEDAKFLDDQLRRQLERVEDELVHTDKRAMQADIARDLEHLARIHKRLAHAVELAEAPVDV